MSPEDIGFTSAKQMKGTITTSFLVLTLVVLASGIVIAGSTGTSTGPVDTHEGLDQSITTTSSEIIIVPDGEYEDSDDWEEGTLTDIVHDVVDADVRVTEIIVPRFIEGPYQEVVSHVTAIVQKTGCNVNEADLDTVPAMLIILFSIPVVAIMAKKS